MKKITDTNTGSTISGGTRMRTDLPENTGSRDTIRNAIRSVKAAVSVAGCFRVNERTATGGTRVVETEIALREVLLFGRVIQHAADLAVGVAPRPQMRQRFVVQRSYPSEIAARWRRHVPDAQFGLFLFDDLVADADGLRRRVLSFLGGDAGKESGVINAAFNRKEDREKVPLSPGIRVEIARHFAAEIRASGEAFGGAAKGWAAKYGL